MSILNQSEETGTPSTPTTGRQKIYPKSGGIYALNDAGVETKLVTGTGTASGTNTGDQTATTVSNTPAGNIAATTVQSAINELDTEKEALSNKDASSGYIGKTLEKLNIWNAGRTALSFLVSLATSERTQNLPDKDGTFAMLDDISSVSIASGSDFYFDNTEIIGAGTGPQTIPVESLLSTPSLLVEEIQSIAVTNQTLLLGDAYMDGAIGSTTIPAGQWEFHIYRYVSATGGISEILQSIYTNHTETGTIAITGTGTSRTATVTGGTPFVAGDAGATISVCAWIQTPNGQFRITGYTSTSVVTIECLSTYTNETGVAFSKDTYRFKATTGDIQETVVTEQLIPYFLVAPITIAATDKLVTRMFAKTDSVSAKTVSFVYGGEISYSHFHSTLTPRHSSLSNLDYANAGHTGFQPTLTLGTGVAAALAVNVGSAGAVALYDADIAAIAGLTSAADKGIQFTGSGIAGLFDLTAAAKTVLDDATVGAMVNTLGGATSLGTGGLVRGVTGTWTPAFGASSVAPSGVTLDIAVGTYTKNGNECTVSGHIRSDAVTDVGSGNLTIVGLPYAAANVTNAWFHTTCSANSFTTNQPSGVAILPNESFVRVYYRAASNSALSSLTVAELANSANSNELSFSITFITA